MRHLEPCNWKWTSSRAQRSTVSSWANSCSFFIFLLPRWVCPGHPGARFAQPEAKLSKQSLALTNPKLNPKPLPNERRQALAVPKVAFKSMILRRAPDGAGDLPQLHPNKTLGPPRPIRIRQTGKSLLFKAVHPVSHGPRRISQYLSHLAATHTLGNQQQGVEPMVITRLIGSPDLVLERQDHILCFGYA